MIKNKIYNGLAFAVIMALIILLLCMGIIAVQKSMKLNLSFAANPAVYCEILVNDEPVFDNKTSTITSGVSLSGNVLTFNSAVADNVMLGENFDLQIKNHADTESAIVVSFSGATINEDSSYSEIIAKGESSAVLDVSTTTKMEITFTKAVEVGLTLSEGVSLDAEHSNLLQTTAGVYYLEQGKNLEAKIIVADGYQTPTYTLNDGEEVEIVNNTFFITFANLLNENGEVNLLVETSNEVVLNFSYKAYGYSSAWNGSNHNADWFFVITVTNDPNFNIQYDNLGANTYEMVWCSSFEESKYYCYTHSGKSLDTGTIYEQGTIEDKLLSSNTSFRYFSTTTNSNLLTESISLTCKPNDKIFIASTQVCNAISEGLSISEDILDNLNCDLVYGHGFVGAISFVVNEPRELDIIGCYYVD